jgi:uncharacterized protein (DUF2141 family)
MPEVFDDESEQRMPSLWQQNHGTLLLAFVGAIFVIGAIILTYQQTRFRKPRFPDSRAIEAPHPEGLVSRVVTAGEESLTISIVGAANSEGVIMVAVYDSNDNFREPAKASLKMAIQIADGGAVWGVPLRELPPSFAIAAYHDENLDGQLNRNPFGIPTERYGFSRNARGLTGPPAFEAAVMNRPDRAAEIEITLR